MPVLIRKPDGPYFSPGDERAFFEWASRIPCIHRLEGVGGTSELRLHVKGRRVSHNCLRELIALFLRYGVSMSQLAQFESPSNRSWFRSESAVWHTRVFGKSSDQRVKRGAARLVPERDWPTPRPAGTWLDGWHVGVFSAW